MQYSRGAGDPALGGVSRGQRAHRHRAGRAREVEGGMMESSKTQIRAAIAAAREQKRGALDEATGKQLLAAYGIAVPKSIVIDGVDDLAAAFAQLTPPLALKIISPDIVHKSDAGGVPTRLQFAA